MHLFGIDSEWDNFVFTRKDNRNLRNNGIIEIRIDPKQIHNMSPGQTARSEEPSILDGYKNNARYLIVSSVLYNLLRFL